MTEIQNRTPKDRLMILPWGLLVASWAVGLTLGSLHVITTTRALPAGGLCLLIGTIPWRSARYQKLRLGLICLAIAMSAVAWWHCTAVDQPIINPVEPQLVNATGRLIQSPRHRLTPTGVMAERRYWTPSTWAFFQVDHVLDGDRWRPVDQTWLLRLPDYDDRLTRGLRITCRGWLTGIQPPQNPGQFDYRDYLAQRGVYRQLKLKSNADWQLGHAPTDWLDRWHLLRWRIADRLQHLLLQQMPDQMTGEQRALLLALIFGDRTQVPPDLDDAFRQSGMAHLLSISGLHVGIILFGIAWIGERLTGRPRWGMILAMAGLAVYLSIVPWRMPVIRAGIMSLALLPALWSRRRIQPMAMLAIAAMAILLAMPRQLFDAGFQLSFVVVAAMICLTGPVTDQLTGTTLDQQFMPARAVWRRRLTGMIVVTTIAWLFAMPLVVWHFGLISLAAWPVAFVALPMVSAMIWLAMTKIWITAIWPLAGRPVGLMLWALSGWMIDLATTTCTLHGTWLWTTHPSPIWVLLTLACIIAVLSTRDRYQRISSLVGLTLCVGWLLIPGTWRHWPDQTPTVKLTVLAVGDGSSILVQSAGHNLLFDCGSMQSADAGRSIVGPALRHLGVRQLDALVISHADLDHYGGVPTLLKQFHVRQLYMTQPMAERLHQTRAPTLRLLHQVITEQRTPVMTLTRGDRIAMGGLSIECLWPLLGERSLPDNDSSLVLSIDAAGRRLLLFGDIQTQAVQAMIRHQIPLNADLVELPHHGAWFALSEQWIDLTRPAVVLQSCSAHRLAEDRWQPLFERHGIKRLSTASLGALSLEIKDNGSVIFSSWRNKTRQEILPACNNRPPKTLEH